LGPLTGTLSSHAILLVQGLNAQTPDGTTTPTEGALRGLARYTADHRTPGHAMAGVFITDSDPDTCSSNDTVLGGIAKSNWDKNGIHTFFVGMHGTDYHRLETWAAYQGAMSHANTNNTCGNGAASCSHYSVDDGTPPAVSDAIHAIRGAVQACSFWPYEPPIGIPNYEKMVVTAESSDGAVPDWFFRMNSAEECVGHGWFLDNNDDPSVISLCPATCAKAQADDGLSFGFLFPCETP